MAVIEARGVSVSVGSEVLLASTTFAVESGDCLAVLGPNGSGKTTLLRTLTGLTRPTTGEVLVHGRRVDARKPAFHAAVAALLDAPAFARELTLAEHLAFVAATWGANRTEALDQAAEMLDLLGIDRLSRRFAHELSSGQRQLFGVALTLVRPAGILVLDEPEQRLDAVRRDRVIDIVAERRSRGTTVVVATHSDAVREGLATEQSTVASS